MESLSKFCIIIFFLGTVCLQLWSRYRSKKTEKEWRSDFEKYQESYRKSTSIDDAIKHINSVTKRSDED